MNVLRSTCYVLMTVLSLTTGCRTPKAPPNPLEGWTFSRSQDANKLDKAIRDDYEDYIKKLPPEHLSFIGTIWFFEDGTGQHAVSIERGIRGKYWHNVLFYNQENHRAKVVIYAHGGYMI